MDRSYGSNEPLEMGSDGPLPEVDDYTFTQHTDLPDTDDELGYPSWRGRCARPSSPPVRDPPAASHPDAVDSSHGVALAPYQPVAPIPLSGLVGMPVRGGVLYGYCVAVPVMLPMPHQDSMGFDMYDPEGLSDSDDYSDISSERESFCDDCINEIVDDCQEPILTDTCDDDVCTICLEGFSCDKRVCLFPVCRHMFHTECLKTCLKRHPRCPNCRQPIL